MQTEVIRDFDPLRLGRLVDRKSLFLFHWRFRKAGVDQGEWSRRMAVELEPMFVARLTEACREGVFEPAAVVGVVGAVSSGDSLILDPSGPGGRGIEIPMARRPDGRCVADLLPTLESAMSGDARPSKIGFFVATLGPGTALKEAALREGGRYEDYHLFHGLAAALAEALAVETHLRVEEMMGLKRPADGRAGTVRLSPGYACCPDLSVQGTVLSMLDAARIGVGMTDAFQMLPELTVSALVIDHPDAEKYM